MISLISANQDDMPDALAALAASAALSVSDIPFQGPISEVRVARIDGEYKVNPSRSELEKADLNIIVAATEENIMMVEGEFEEVAEADLLEALKIAHDNIKLHCQAQKELTIETGNVEKRTYDHEVNDEDLAKKVAADLYDKVYAVYNAQIANKAERGEKLKTIRDEYIDALPEDSEVNIDLLKKIGRAHV